MKYDGNIDIAVGLSAKSKTWKNKSLPWSELVDKLKKEHKTSETYKEFIQASKDEQSKIKDVGGFVGGYLRLGRRKPENVVHRQLLTLDIDFAHMDLWEDFRLQYDSAALLHSTHKHSEANPRFRLIMPTSREMSRDEYVAVGRKVAGTLGVELFDNTTFEPNRLMYWPSNPVDVEYYCKVQDGPWLDVDQVLASYIDWKDSSLWPTAAREEEKVQGVISKQEDPSTKKGVIGAFCRSYTVTEAIETYLTEEYAPVSGMQDRYTYLKGTTAGGLIVYEDKFAYSHHGTDPCGGKLCNSFDLVRVHKFGHLDETSADTKSYNAMVEFSRKDKKVKSIIASENIEEAKYDFSERPDLPDADNISWMEELEVDKQGRYLSTATNINLILSEDARLKGVFKQNDFDNKKYLFYSPPWRKITYPEPIKNVDMSGLRNYMECVYGIVGNLKVEDSVNLIFDKNSFHPIRDYLKALSWDGVKRVDKLLVDYFGVKKDVYHTEIIRKTLVGAVARVFEPGIKFDTVLVLCGPQGTGKSTFVHKIAMGWGSDTFLTVHGKEAFEQLQGAWIIEMAELSGLKKAEVEAIKHFISKQEDTFRPAYGRTTETFKRQCVFIGTINPKTFLTDPSGNRRFLPVDVNPDNVKKNVFTDLTQAELNQIWAEAVALYKAKEPLYLSQEASIEATRHQHIHSEIDERAGLVEEFLNTKLPMQWEDMEIAERRFFLESGKTPENGFYRDSVSVVEIWCECLGKEKHMMDRYKTRDINDIMRSFKDWVQTDSTKTFTNYGKQRYYKRQGLY